MKNKINVTKTYLPPYREYEKYLKIIWKNHWVTNEGIFAKKLEDKLTSFLDVEHLRLVANGTLGLQMAIRGLNLKGKIITTPFSYIASSSSIVWEGCEPIFADIDPDTLCISPREIEKSIDKQTEGILAVHVYGNVCAVDEIANIAKVNKLKVIYDAAHAFSVKYKDRSVLNYGDISILSLHATKIFHTVEGGAVIANDEKVDAKINHIRYFGHTSPTTFNGLGINAKISELHAAMGLAVLPHFSKIFHKRKEVSKKYDEYFKLSMLRTPFFNKNSSKNYAYYPVIFPNETKMLKVIKKLNDQNVIPRRYFYPSLNELPFLKKTKCPVAEDISKRVLCLPLYDSLSGKDVDLISKTILESL